VRRFSSSKQILLSALASLMLSGCTNSIPQFIEKFSISAPLINGKNSHTVTIYSPTASVTFDGTCDPKILGLEISFNQGSSYQNLFDVINQNQSDSNCNDGVYTVHIDDISIYLTIDPNVSQDFPLYLRGSTSLSNTSTSQVTVRYLTGVGTVSANTSIIEKLNAGSSVAGSIFDVKITLLREDNVPVAGVTPTFDATDSNSTNVYQTCSVSDATGVSICQMQATRAESKQLKLLSPVEKFGSSVVIDPGPFSATHSLAQVSNTMVNKGSSVILKVHAHDSFSNPLTLGGLSGFTASLSNVIGESVGTVDPNFVDNNNGSYETQLLGTVSGTPVTVTVFHSGIPIGTNLSVQVQDDPNQPIKLSIVSTDTIFTAGTCHAFKVVSHDSSNNLKNVSAAHSINLTGSVNIFTMPTCSSGGSNTFSTSIASGTSESNIFYVRMDIPGSYSLNATDLYGGILVLAGTSLPITFGPAPASKLVFSVAPQASISAGQCISLSVESQDMFNNISAVSANITLNLADGAGMGVFYSDVGCSTSISSASLAIATSNLNFYYRNTKAEAVTLDIAPTSALTGLTHGVTVNPGSPAILNFSAISLSKQVNTCSDVFRFKTYDSFNNLSSVTLNSTFNLNMTAGSGGFYSDSSCSTSIASVTINTGFSAGEFYYKGTTAGNPNIEVSKAGYTSATTPFSVLAQPLTHLSISMANSGPAGACYAVTIETNDAGGIAVAPNNIAINLTNDSPGASTKFYSDTGCNSEVTSTTILTGTSGINVYAKSTLASTILITATDNSGASLTAATKNFIWMPGAYNKVVLSGSATSTSGMCSVYTIVAKDIYDNLVNVNSSLNISLTTGDAGATFHTTVGCNSNNAGSYVMAIGTNTISVYLKSGYAGNYTLQASPATGTSSSLVYNVNAGAPTELFLTFTDSVLDVIAGECKSVTISLSDSYNDTVSGSSTNINLATSGGAGSFYSAGTCSTTTTTAMIPAGNMSIVVYYKNTVVTPTLSLTASDSSSLLSPWTESSGRVIAGALDHFNVSGVVNGQVWGTNHTVNLLAKDAFNNTTTLSGPVTVGVASNAGTNSTDYSSSTSVTFSSGSGNIGAVHFKYAGTFNLTYSYTGKSGTLSGILVSAKPVSVSALFPVNGINWNDYVQSSASIRWQNSDTSCNNNSSSQLCLHGGEMRKVVPGETSCTGLELVESLSAFRWICDDSLSYVRFISVGLKPEKRLFDLTDTNTWRPNFIEVYKNSKLLYSSTASAWWTNPVNNLPDSSASISSISTSGTIYRLAANMENSLGYNINGDKIAIAMPLGVSIKLSNSIGINCSTAGELSAASFIVGVCVGNHANLWLEGSIASNTNVHYGLKLADVRHSKIRNFSVVGGSLGSSSNSAIFLKYNSAGSFFNRFENIEVSNAYKGLFLQSINVMNNSIVGLKANNNFTEGLDLSGIGSGNAISKALVTANEGVGIKVSSTTANSTVLNHVTIANNKSYGLAQSGGTNITTANQLLILNNGASGIYFSGAAGNSLSQIASSGNTGSNLNLSFSATNMKNNLYIESSSACAVSTIADDFLDGSTTCDPQSSVFSLSSGSNLTLGVFGNSGFTDTANPVSNFSTTYSSLISFSDLIAAWTQFDFKYRSWGLSSGAFDVNAQGACLAGDSCQIWDWRINPVETSIRNRSQFGGLGTNDAFLNNSACPGAVSGNFVANLSNTVTYFLANALELTEDGIGNDDGLCESNEACSYSSAFGAHQGSVNFAETCNFTNGLLNNIKVFNSSF
jgi:hypothetical protein